jgi:excinuclease ABC subunit C
VDDEYPRVMFTRERHRPGVWYFGPYANAKKVRETLDVLNRVFPYRPCEGPKPGRHSGIPCLDYHIDRCLAPCVGYVSREDYRAIIDGVIEFLSGDVKPIQRELEQKMHAAAREERFEDAARYRNRLFAVQHLVERQSVERQSVGNVDVIGFAAEEDRAVVQVFPLRGGKMIDRHSFHLENVAGQDVTTVIESFGLEYYGNAPSVPPQIVVPRDSGDLTALAELLSERRGARVEVRVAERGEKRRLQQLADENARHALVTEQAATEQKRARRVEALEELREALNLESLPLRIECYDISHAMGQDPVASMVVFQDGLPRKADYRKFGIKAAGAEPGAADGGRVSQPGGGFAAAASSGDDFAAMAEVISRRFARLSDGTGEGHDSSFATAPNLVVIDGGKGQLSAALAAMQAYDLPRVAVIALAKRIEEVFVPGESEPILLSRHNPGLQLLQRIRDEAHRFALGFHRQRRESRGFASLFDDLQGIGPARRRALLQHFGSVEEMAAASQEELEGVPGVPAAVARRIYAQPHKTGRAG